MLYRTIGSTGVQASILGMGCMRLPATDDASSSANIDQAATTALIRTAIDSGVNYIDTAYVYHQQHSETATGRALADGYRQRVSLATKLPLQMVQKKADFDRILDTSLTRLGTQHIDFYLFHGIGAQSWQKILDLDLLSAAEQARASGRIGHICFSFHDDYAAFETILRGYDNWGFAQVQYNYMDVDYQAGARGIQLAKELGVGVVVMEPLRGGKLARPIPEVEQLLANEGFTGDFVQLALRFVWDNAGVDLALSGMGTLAQLEQNLASANLGVAGGLTSQERQLIEQVRQVYAQKQGIPCTGCGYCLPCPQGLRIPEALGLYNEALIYGYPGESRRVYNFFKPGPAAGCSQCGQCEAKCPQQIPISSWMPRIDAQFAE